MGESGRVHASDTSRMGLGRIAEKAEQERLRNIVRIDALRDRNILLEDETLDDRSTNVIGT